MDRAARDMGPISTRDGEADAQMDEDETRTEAREDPTWNPGGVGNEAGEDIATPSSTWNPGGTGNVTEDEEQLSTGTLTGTGSERTGSTAERAESNEDQLL
jgi:hypothetical protein